MTTLMLVVLVAWFVSLFLGPTLYAAMGFAGFAFLIATGIPGIVIPQKIAMAANSFQRWWSAGCAAGCATRTSSAPSSSPA
jgi:hypothetical protein